MDDRISGAVVWRGIALRGGWHEIVASAAIDRHWRACPDEQAIRRTDRVFEPLAAFIASLLAAVIATAGFPISVFLVTLAGVIVLIPGLMLTTAMTELDAPPGVPAPARFMGGTCNCRFGTTVSRLLGRRRSPSARRIRVR